MQNHCLVNNRGPTGSKTFRERPNKSLVERRKLVCRSHVHVFGFQSSFMCYRDWGRRRYRSRRTTRKQLLKHFGLKNGRIKFKQTGSMATAAEADRTASQNLRVAEAQKHETLAEKVFGILEKRLSRSVAETQFRDKKRNNTNIRTRRQMTNAQKPKKEKITSMWRRKKTNWSTRNITWRN